MTAPATLGVVTIGQAPRDDLLPELTPVLPGCRVVQHGALDGLSAEAIDRLAPGAGEEPLVTRLTDGSGVVLAHDHAVPLVAKAVARAEDDGADVTLLACSGTFPPLPHHRPLLLTETLAHHAVATLAADSRVGIVRPLPDQLDDGRAAWERSLGHPVAASAAASPYHDDPAAIGHAAERIADRCDVIVLDCIGYDEHMRAAAAAAAHRPVLLVRTLAARLAGELLTATAGTCGVRQGGSA